MHVEDRCLVTDGPIRNAAGAMKVSTGNTEKIARAASFIATPERVTRRYAVDAAG
jgi:hypothetical protein